MILGVLTDPELASTLNVFIVGPNVAHIQKTTFQLTVSKRAWWPASILAIACFVAACGDKAAQNSADSRLPEVILGNVASTLERPTPIAKSTKLIDGLAAGDVAALVLDKCPVPSPEGLGSLMCGASYEIYWEKSTKRWVTFGPNGTLPQGKGFENTLGKYPGSAPSSRVAIVWGLWLTLNDDYTVQMEKGPIIGTLRHLESRVDRADPLQAINPDSGRRDTATGVQSK